MGLRPPVSHCKFVAAFSILQEIMAISKEQRCPGNMGVALTQLATDLLQLVTDMKSQPSPEPS